MISSAIIRAYRTMADRKWDTIYWAVDLHGVCLSSNYETGVHEFLSQNVIDSLRYLSSLEETKIILWSSVHDEQKDVIIEKFESNGIKIFGFNENPAEKDTATGCFKEKFYFSVLVDDKAGFDPGTGWPLAVSHVKMMRRKYNMESAVPTKNFGITKI